MWQLYFKHGRMVILCNIMKCVWYDTVNQISLHQWSQYSLPLLYINCILGVSLGFFFCFVFRQYITSNKLFQHTSFETLHLGFKKKWNILRYAHDKGQVFLNNFHRWHIFRKMTTHYLRFVSQVKFIIKNVYERGKKIEWIINKLSRLSLIINYSNSPRHICKPLI